MRGGRGDTRASWHMIKIVNRGIRNEIRSDYQCMFERFGVCWMLDVGTSRRNQKQFKIKSKSIQNQFIYSLYLPIPE